MLPSSSQRLSTSLAWPCMTLRCSTGAAACTWSRSQASALRRVRTFAASTTSPLEMSTIGLMDSIEPIIAWALPIRPPLRRFSRVSRVPKTWVRREALATSASMESASAPAAAALAACSTSVPRPAVTDRLSSTRMSPRLPVSARTASAPWAADCMVAEIDDDKLTQNHGLTTAVQGAGERLLEATGRRCGGLRQLVAGGHALVEVLDSYLLAIDELFGPEADEEWHNLHSQPGQFIIAEIAGTVGHNGDCHFGPRILARTGDPGLDRCFE